MRMMGLLQPGVVRVVNPLEKKVIGYAFTVDNAGGQLQRWLLFEHPHNTLDIVPPPENMARWSLSDWQSSVDALWRPGSFYVWAQADVYRYEDVSEKRTWKKIPPASHLPAPTYPDVGECDFQLDPTGGRLIEVLQYRASGLDYRASEPVVAGRYDPTGGRLNDVLQHGVNELVSRANDPLDVAGVRWSRMTPFEGRGMAFVVNGLLDPASAEYWMLPAAYEPAGKSTSVAIMTGKQETRTLQDFIDVANQGWGPGGTFVITGCVNYRGEHAPACDVAASAELAGRAHRDADPFARDAREALDWAHGAEGRHAPRDE